MVQIQKEPEKLSLLNVPSDEHYDSLLLPLVLAMLERQLSNLDGCRQVRFSSNLQACTLNCCASRWCTAL
jgi:hypothetical protein